MPSATVLLIEIPFSVIKINNTIMKYMFQSSRYGPNTLVANEINIINSVFTNSNFMIDTILGFEFNIGGFLKLSYD